MNTTTHTRISVKDDQIITELEKTIENREANPLEFHSEFAKGELRAYKEVLRRVKQIIGVEN